MECFVFPPPNIENNTDIFKPKGCIIIPEYTECCIKVYSKPFDQGEERYCFYGQQWLDDDDDDDNEENLRKVVLKTTKESDTHFLLQTFSEPREFECPA